MHWDFIARNPEIYLTAQHNISYKTLSHKDKQKQSKVPTSEGSFVELNQSASVAWTQSWSWNTEKDKENKNKIIWCFINLLVNLDGCDMQLQMGRSIFNYEIKVRVYSKR